MKAGVFLNERDEPEIAIQVEKDAKGMTWRKGKRPEHALHEGFTTLPLIFNPILFYLSIFEEDNALKDYKSVEEILQLKPQGEEMILLRWNDDVLNKPLFTNDAQEMESAAATSRYLFQVGQRAGYLFPPVFHDFRAEGLLLLGKWFYASLRNLTDISYRLRHGVLTQPENEACGPHGSQHIRAFLRGQKCGN